MYDGHGSTPQLARYSGGAVSVVERYSYDGYGLLLQDDSIASSNPGKVAAQATNLLYCGEHFDTDAQQYYLRARWYNALTGLFNRTDPFSGNLQDPQSLHKYLYCHANPINATDPPGTLTLAETLTVMGKIMKLISVTLTVITVAAYGYRTGGIIFKLSSGDEKLIDEAFLEAEDLAAEIALDVALVVATFGIGKLLQKAGQLLKGGKRLAAVARLNRNVKYGAKAERYILGSIGKKTAFTTSLGKVVPDNVTRTTIQEVKNVKYLSKCKQMRKMIQLAKGGSGEPAKKLILYVRQGENTVISGPLMKEFENLKRLGLFELKRGIPKGLWP